MSNMRKLIAKSMYNSLQNSAQLTHMLGADARKVQALRKKAKKAFEEGKIDTNITVNDFVCFAVIKALKKFPNLNSHCLGDAMRVFKPVHLGLAVDTERGLMVPAVKNADDLSLVGLAKNLKKVAESQEWDIVCIQEHTGNAAAWSWNSTEKGHIQGLMDKVAATQKKRPLFYYILSQTYYDENKIGSGSRPSITWTDQAGMYDVTVAFAKKVMEEIPFVNVISTGTTLQNLRQTHLVNSMCLTRDGYHMDYGISRYAAACCLYQTMLYPRYRVPLSENTFRISDSSTADGSYTTPVTDENAPIAQQAALDAVAHPFEITFREFDYGGSGAAGGSLSGKDQGTL